jgi:hypothetical protein
VTNYKRVEELRSFLFSILDEGGPEFIEGGGPIPWSDPSLFPFTN